LLWVDTSYDEKGIACCDDDRTNITEAKLIAQALVRINQQMRQNGFDVKAPKGKQKVGIVSFYQAQCRVIREAIKNINQGNLKFDAIDVEINTVIRYQGKEKPIILISLVRNDGKEKTYHRRGSNANIARFEFINVAMSRAQDLLVQRKYIKIFLKDLIVRLVFAPSKNLCRHAQINRTFLLKLNIELGI